MPMLLFGVLDLEKYDLREWINCIFEEYKNKQTEDSVIFKIMVDSELPKELVGMSKELLEILKLLLDEAFLHTFSGKVVLKLSAVVDTNELSPKFPEKFFPGSNYFHESNDYRIDYENGKMNHFINIEFSVLDTGDYYNLDSKRIKECRERIEALDSFLDIESVDRLGTRASFVVAKRLITDEVIGDYEAKTVLGESKKSFSKRDKIEKLLEVEKGLELIGNNREVYYKLLKEYVKSSSGFIENLKAHEMDEDLKEYRITAHSIKSGSYSIGAIKTGDLAKEMEYAARDSHREEIEKKNNGLIATMEDTVHEIKDYLVSNGVEVEEQAKNIYEELVIAIDDFDMDKALAILEQLEEKEKKEEYTEIKKLLQELNYIEAKTLAMKLC